MDSGFPVSGVRSFPRGAQSAKYLCRRAMGTYASPVSNPAKSTEQYGDGWGYYRNTPNRRGASSYGRFIGIWLLMALVIILIAAIIVVAAIRNSQGDLFNALGQDVPAFVIWAAAIFAVGAIGFIKPLRPVSQGLLVLILLVIVMNNYQGIISGLTNASQLGAGSPSGTNAPASPPTSTKSTNNTIAQIDSLSNDVSDLGIAAGA